MGKPGQQVAGNEDVLSAQRKAVVLLHLELAFAEIAARAEAGWISQKHSPLGRHGHIEAVRRRLREGKSGVGIYGRLHLLTVDALAEEYFRAGRTIGETLRAANDGGRA